MSQYMAEACRLGCFFVSQNSPCYANSLPMALNGMSHSPYKVVILKDNSLCTNLLALSKMLLLESLDYTNRCFLLAAICAELLVRCHGQSVKTQTGSVWYTEIPS